MVKFLEKDNVEGDETMPRSPSITRASELLAREWGVKVSFLLLLLL